MTALLPQRTDFTLDDLGRYVCNGFDEALASVDRAQHGDARPFDLIVLGGGSFGAALTSHLFYNDRSRAHRILVLEAGQMVVPEHVQNLPPPFSPSEVWGMPWASDSPRTWNQRFPGLAFCIGGRSVFWGGWSPYFIDSELSPAVWPAGVRRDLMTNVLPRDAPAMSYLDEAAEQIGTDATNDFVRGPLHDVLRDRLFEGLKARTNGSRTALVGNRGTPMTATESTEKLKSELEAPLAVQSASPRPGFFPFNKFNGVQLLMRAARIAQVEAEQSAVGDAAARNVKKRLMIVPNAHVIRLERQGRRISRIVTNKGSIDVVDGASVFLALGTIESTRLALTTLPNSAGLIGRNLMAHLRSNLTIRAPRAGFPTLSGLRELAVSALFVKGVHTHSDGTLGHFHVQITASGVGELGVDSEAELFKKIPDVDTLERFRGLDDQWIVMTLRGIGEMIGDKNSTDPENRVTLDRLGPHGAYDYGQPRALVRLEADDPADPLKRNLKLWDAMDAACDEVAQIFAGAGAIQYLSGPGGAWQNTPPGPDARRDTLSSTHHEGGTLWMGDDPATSVTDQWGRFHYTDNLHAVGPALLPTLGSPNPMLSGVALARRAADHVLPAPSPAAVESGFQALFDGTDRTFNLWQSVGGGAFALINGLIVAQPEPGSLGLLYYARQAFGDFTLRLEFRLDRPDDNSGVFIRSRDPQRRVPERNNPAITHAYGNKAWVAVDTGFEIQIDEQAGPDGVDRHRTGAIYDISVGQAAGQQDYQHGPALIPGDWNEYEITASGQTYTVTLNGQQTTTFTNQDTFRGRPATADPTSGYLGVQAHTGQVAYRNVRIRKN